MELFQRKFNFRGNRVVLTRLFGLDLINHSFCDHRRIFATEQTYQKVSEWITYSHPSLGPCLVKSNTSSVSCNFAKINENYGLYWPITETIATHGIHSRTAYLQETKKQFNPHPPHSIQVSSSRTAYTEVRTIFYNVYFMCNQQLFIQLGHVCGTVGEYLQTRHLMEWYTSTYI